MTSTQTPTVPDWVSIDTCVGARTFPVTDPASGEEIARVLDTGPAEAAAALDAAVSAQAEWAARPARERADILLRADELMRARTDDLSLLMTREMGRVLPESIGEVGYAAGFLRWFAEEGVRIQGRTTRSPSGTGRIVVNKVPLGPCYAITPWNFPLAMGVRKAAPALAAGCTMIIKPAPETPLTMLAFAQIMADAGVPKGVLSVLPTSEPGPLTRTLLADPRLRKLTFTGSTSVGRLLLAQAADGILRTSMELGGNAPFLVFADADLDAAVDGAMAAKTRNAGQVCTAANRFLVANEVREEFTARLVRRFESLRVGPGTDPGNDIGPLVSVRQRDRVAALVDDAVNRGGRVRTGGAPVPGPGAYYLPTVLDEVPPDARIRTEEIFGPVAVITGFTSEDAAVAAANDTHAGLAAYFFTEGLDRALRVSGALEAGMVGVNRGVIADIAAPFGGVKQSGLGSEGGIEGIEEFLETRYVGFTH